MDVLVVYEGARGSTRRVAEALVEAAVLHGHRALVAAMEEVTVEHVGAAEGLLVGCWSESDAPLGGDATQHVLDWIRGFSDLGGKPVGVYCASSLVPSRDDELHTAHTLRELHSRLEQKGAHVTASKAFERRALDHDSALFVEAAFGATDA